MRGLLIIGAASGLGKNLAEVVARDQPDVPLFLADVDMVSLAKVSAAVSARGHCKCDVLRDEDVAVTFDAASRAMPGFCSVVNTAGVAANGREGAQTGGWTRIMDINAGGTIRVSVHAIAHNENGGKIETLVNIASLAGIYPAPMSPVYAASKAAVLHYGRSVPAASGVRVITVCPGFAETPMVTNQDKGVVDYMKSMQDGQLLSPAQVSRAILHALCCPPPLLPSGSCLRVTVQQGIDVVSQKTHVLSKL